MSITCSEVTVPGATVLVEEFNEEGPQYSVQNKTSNSVHFMILPYTGYSFVSPLTKKARDFSVGRVVFFQADTLLAFRGEGGFARCISCIFDSSRFSEVTGITHPLSELQLAASFDVRSAGITQTLARLWQEIREPAEAGKYVMEGLVLVLMTEISRHLREVQTNSIHNGLARWQLQKIRRYVEEEGNCSATAHDLAKICGISHSWLQRAFKAATGATLHTYIESIRLERAKTLLLESDLPLKVISGQLGFSNPSGLSIAFRRTTGTSPRVFRQRGQLSNADRGVEGCA